MKEQGNNASEELADDQRKRRSPLTGFRWVAVGTVVVLLSLVVAAKVAKFRSVREKICCDCNLKQIGLSFRIFANDHSDKFPMQLSTNQGGTMEYIGAGQVFRHFVAISNELVTPLVLTCPADNQQPVAGVVGSRMPITNFAKLSDSNISYFISLDATDGNPNAILSDDRNWLVSGTAVGAGLISITTNSAVTWSGAIHKFGGNIVLGDGNENDRVRSSIDQLIRSAGANASAAVPILIGFIRDRNSLCRGYAANVIADLLGFLPGGVVKSLARQRLRTSFGHAPTGRFWVAPGLRSRRRTEPRLVTSSPRLRGERGTRPKRFARWFRPLVRLASGGCTRFVTTSLARPGECSKKADSRGRASCANIRSSRTSSRENPAMSSVTP